MNRKLYALLCDNFNRQKDDEYYQTIKELFENEDPLLLERAIITIIKEDKYFPSVARIREVLKEQSNIPLTEEEKLRRWKKEGITPNCMTKVPSEEIISDEEKQELEDFFGEFR